jgi:hypothetical protein
MFVIACRETGCVKLTCTQDPREVMELSPNLDEHFDVLEFDDDTDYTDKHLKVIDGSLVDLGYIRDMENIVAEDCNNCPPLTE